MHKTSSVNNHEVAGGGVTTVKKRILVFLTLGCLLACLTMLASPAFARFPDGIDPQVAKITIVIKIHGTQVWLQYWDFVPIVDEAATVRIPSWFYMKFVQLLGTRTIVTPFTTKGFLWALPIEIMLTSKPQPLTIHFEPT
jgi:hypothetical protein